MVSQRAAIKLKPKPLVSLSCEGTVDDHDSMCFKNATRQLGLTNNGLQCAGTQFFMIRNRNGDSGGFSALLHHYMASFPANFAKTVAGQ